MIPALAPKALEAPSTNTLHGRTSMWQTVSKPHFGENSAYEKLYNISEKREKLYRLTTKKLSDVELDH